MYLVQLLLNLALFRLMILSNLCSLWKCFVQHVLKHTSSVSWYTFVVCMTMLNDLAFAVSWWSIFNNVNVVIDVLRIACVYYCCDVHWCLFGDEFVVRYIAKIFSCWWIAVAWIALQLDDLRLGLCRVVHHLAYCMVGMIQNLAEDYVYEVYWSIPVFLVRWKMVLSFS